MYELYEITQRVLDERPTAVVRRRLEVPQLEGWVAAAAGEVRRAVEAAGSTVVGPPFTRCLTVEGTAACCDAEAGYPVAEPFASRPGSDVQPSRLPGGSAAVTVHDGPAEAMAPAYEALDAWIAEQRGVPDGPPWQNYLTLPQDTGQPWRTEIVEVVQPYTS